MIEAKNLSYYLFSREINVKAGFPVHKIVENSYFSAVDNTIGLVLSKANEYKFKKTLDFAKEKLNIVESIDISEQYFYIRIPVPEKAQVLADKYRNNTLSTLTREEKIDMVTFVFSNDKFMHGIINSIILKSPVLKFQLEMYLGREVDPEEEFLNPNWELEDFKKSIYYIIWQKNQE